MSNIKQKINNSKTTSTLRWKEIDCYLLMNYFSSSCFSSLFGFFVFFFCIFITNIQCCFCLFCCYCSFLIAYGNCVYLIRMIKTPARSLVVVAHFVKHFSTIHFSNNKLQLTTIFCIYFSYYFIYQFVFLYSCVNKYVS